LRLWCPARCGLTSACCRHALRAAERTALVGLVCGFSSAAWEAVHLRSGVPGDTSLHSPGWYDGFQGSSSLQPARQMNAVVRRTMHQSSRCFAVSAIKGAVIATGLFVCVFVFRLGFFVPVVVLFGAWLAAATTVRQQNASRARGAMLAVAVTFYALTTIAVYAGLTNQVSRRLIQTTWRDCGAANSYGESEVVFDFADFPATALGCTRPRFGTTSWRPAKRELSSSSRSCPTSGACAGFAKRASAACRISAQ
jgi:hypothetical protein